MVSACSLIIEVTRRCNMRCDHCLRGDAEDLDISNEVLDRILDSSLVEGPHIVFTGGEPTLNIRAIQYFIEGLKRRGARIDGFYIKSNGKDESIELMLASLELYALSDNKEMCALEVSGDQYHEGYSPELYKGLAFYRFDERDISDKALINDGKSFEYGIGSRSEYPADFIFDEYDSEDTCVEELYISSNGNVVGSCNMSFERVDEESLGNILTEDLEDIILREYTRALEKVA